MAVVAEEVALGHFIVENRIDILEFGAVGAVVDEAGDAALFAREGVGALHLGAFVAMVEMEGDGGLGGHGPGAFQTSGATELLCVDVLLFGVFDLGMALGLGLIHLFFGRQFASLAIGHESGVAVTVALAARLLECVTKSTRPLEFGKLEFHGVDAAMGRPVLIVAQIFYFGIRVDVIALEHVDSERAAFNAFGLTAAVVLRAFGASSFIVKLLACLVFASERIVRYGALLALGDPPLFDFKPRFSCSLEVARRVRHLVGLHTFKKLRPFAHVCNGFARREIRNWYKLLLNTIAAVAD